MMLLAALPLFTLAAAADVPKTSDLADAYFHFTLGMTARVERGESEALEELRKAQALDPTSGAIRAEIARLLRDTGHVDDALKEAREAARLDPESVEAELVLGQTLYMMASRASDEELLKESAAAYEAVARLAPRDLEALQALGDIYRRLGEHERAADAWERFSAADPGNVDALMRLGQHYLAADDMEKAASAFERALVLEPSVQSYQSLGAIYSRAQKYEQAATYYRRAREMEPGNLLVRLSLAETLMRDRRFEEARDETDGALGLDPQNRFAMHIKGQALRELRDFSGAMAVVETLLLRDPGDLDAALLKITILEAQHEWAAAAKAIEAGLRRDRSGEDADASAQQDRRLYIHLGLANTQLSRHAAAAKAFAQARAAGEPDADLFGYEIEANLRARDLDAAATAAGEARQAFPDVASLAALQATVLRERGQEAEAEKVVSALRSDEGNKRDALVAIADYYRRGRRYSEAAKALRQASKLAPEDVPILFQLGAMLERQRRQDDAEAVFRKALTLRPDSAPVLNYLGYMNANRGIRLEEALGLIEKAVELDPESGAYLDSLGWAHFRLGRIDLAEKFLRKAATKIGNNAVVLDHLGDVLNRQHRVREALHYWERALTGEDEDGELDRAAVEAKIRGAEVALGDSQPK
jgi:tetratricopeptide (TPR) repeat protein